jgi:hypothetical protein
MTEIEKRMNELQKEQFCPDCDAPRKTPGSKG